MPTLYFHIGQAKCGTTAIQRFCSEHSEELGQRGLAYVALGRDVLPVNHKYLYLSFLEASGGRNQTRFPAKPLRETLATLREETLTNGPRDSLVSFEGFSALSMQRSSVDAVLRELREAFAGVCQLVFVYYVRDPFELLVSNYNQRCKARKGFVGPFVDFVMTSSDATLDQSLVYDDYARAFGKRVVIPKLYGKKQGADFIRDFLETLGCSWLDLPEVPPINPRMPNEELEQARVAGNSAQAIPEQKIAELNWGRPCPSPASWANFERRLARANANNRALFARLGVQLEPLRIEQLFWHEREVNNMSPRRVGWL